MIELLLTPEQHIMLADLVEAAIEQCREDCCDFEPGDKEWNELVARAKALQGLLSEIETA